MDVGTAVLLSIPCALAAWTPGDGSPQTSPSLQKPAGRLGLLRWYPAVCAPAATALCGSWGRFCTPAPKTNTLVVFGSAVPCWGAAVSWGKTRLTLAIGRAQQSRSGVAGWGWEGLGQVGSPSPGPRLGWNVALLGTPLPPILERMWLGGCGRLAPVPGSVVTVK